MNDSYIYLKADEFLKLLKEYSNDISIIEFCNNHSTDFDITWEVFDLLEDLDFINNIDTSAADGKDRLVKLNSKGKVFIKLGNSIEKNYLDETEKEEQNKNLQFLQITKLEKELKNMDNLLKQQIAFNKTSIERNEQQMSIIKDQKLIIWLTLGLSILSLIISILN